jgi:hypothetical protein
VVKMLLTDYNVLISEDGTITRQDGYVYSHSRDRYGYARVYLTDVTTGKRKGEFVHRLLAKAFIPNPDNKPCVNHINGDKTDNSLSNLEWNTHKQNTRHAINTGLWDPHAKAQNNLLRDKAIIELYSSGNYTMDQLAQVFECTQVNIHRVISK